MFKKLLLIFVLFIQFGCASENDSSNVDSSSVDSSSVDSSNEEMGEAYALFIFEDNDSYFIVDADANNDSLMDKIVSHKPYQGNELFVFIAKDEDYEFAIHTVNFSEDGGHQITGIEDHEQGFIIKTAFPDQGYFLAEYYVVYVSSKWVLKNTVYKTTVPNQSGDMIYVCDVEQNLDMQSPDLFEKVKWIPDETVREEVCSTQVRTD